MINMVMRDIQIPIPLPTDHSAFTNNVFEDAFGTRKRYSRRQNGFLLF